MSRYITLFVILLFPLLTQCKFEVSPYSADVPRLLLNQEHVQLLKAKEQEASREFKIAITADVHNYYKETAQLINQINQDPGYLFTIIAGDITNLGLKEEVETANSFFYQLKEPFLVVVGNHDLLANGKIIYRRTFGQENFYFTYGGVLFVFLNTNNWESEEKSPDLEWIESVLSSSAATHKILVSHVSLQDPDRFTEEQISDWVQLIDRHQVSYVINGHNHNPMESMLGSAKQLTVGSPVKGSFYELQFSPQGVTHQRKSF